MFVLSGLLFSYIIWTVEGSDCLCATADLKADSTESLFVLPNGACAEITDRITGNDHTVWYDVKYNNKTGWIPDDKAMMSFSQCKGPDCRDIATVCASVTNVCVDYELWAYQYCRKHCKQCDIQPTMCVDEEYQCSRYGKSVCTQYQEWSHQKCRNYCGFCGDICLDKEKDCSYYEKSVCTKYPQWALEHCQKFCNLCNYKPKATTRGTTTTTTTTPTTKSSCKDMDGIDCNWLDSNSGVCKDAASAIQFCPKYCKVCDTRDGQRLIGR